ncbi:MAG TPA: SMI1/KNR4 family protein [Aggregatilineaceae bacterium]|jgi:hypothetical protein|nr:SMI1/KNR4 family protein [Aggregatilineaceae bacterium]
MWREFIRKLSPDCTFFPPATPEQIAAVEAALGTALPEKLKGLLAETNGMWGGTGENYIWPLERIAKDNHRYWTDLALADLYMPFTALLFFGDDGGGDQYACRILAGVVRDNDIFGWNHELDSRTWVAPSLERYLSGIIRRELKWS